VRGEKRAQKRSSITRKDRLHKRREDNRRKRNATFYADERNVGKKVTRTGQAHTQFKATKTKVRKRGARGFHKRGGEKGRGKAVLRAGRQKNWT